MSVVVADAVTGSTLYQRGGTDRLMPASNTKIPTSLAAMAVLGPDYRFRTDVLADGRRSGSTLRGDLYLRGTGDPTALAADYDRLAAGVAAAGVRRVTGQVVPDDTRFDANRLGRSWAADDESSYYSAPISALTLAPDTDYDAGTVVVEVAPGGREGARPRVRLLPGDGGVRVAVRATTAAPGSAHTLTVEREHATNTIAVTGSLPLGAAAVKEWVAVQDPTRYAATVFAAALARHGVRVEDGVQGKGRATPAGATSLAVHASMPLRELVRPFMKLSNNMHAEALTKAMAYETTGRPGNWADGLAAVEGYLRGHGVDTGTIRQVDGSGLSRMNLFPAAQLAALLLAVRDEPWFGDWYAALPVACAPDRAEGGTLRTRMCGTPAALNAHAKTGSLTGASALSGYVTDKAGRKLVFSVVLADYLAPSVKSVEDAVVVTLAGSDTAKGAISAASPERSRTAPAPADVECSWRKPVRC
ncbi:D-alanyl-D-alanine carboxypeptidase/D-alanyl-D-alanine endopeptidase [Streptomyces solincola]|uniref:D-alanyl-D-alanine carboxypeptidase/D-alanyl-D-alanine endopeptidase n=1 Tax=Streptomyces solincola TaxID=2100817 RepID=UPI00268A73BC|nr:D-alanyl-D-alanine carboxypeptidase/D-alanyl-D-alanine-endopeptidase [Streptomyces solincola]